MGGRQTISPKKHFFLFLASKFPKFAFCLLQYKVKDEQYFSHGLIWLYHEQFSQIASFIQIFTSCSLLSIPICAYKRLISTNWKYSICGRRTPFMGEGQTIDTFTPFWCQREKHSIQTNGNYFEYYSYQGAIFFWWYIWKIGNIVLRRISSSWEKNNGNIHFEVKNSACPNRQMKKTYACRHPQMLYKKSQKTTLLDIWWLVVKKSCCYIA